MESIIIICDDSGTGKSHTCGRVGDRNKIKINNNTNRKREGQREREIVQGCTIRTGWSGEEGARKTREKKDGKRKKKNNQTAIELSNWPGFPLLLSLFCLPLTKTLDRVSFRFGTWSRV